MPSPHSKPTTRCPVYLHPAAASNPAIIARIQRRTGLRVIVGGSRHPAPLRRRPRPARGCRMSQRINLLLLLIVDTVAQVSAKGRWTPYLDVGSRNCRASLYFRPADFDYSKPDGSPALVESHSTRLVPDDEHSEEELVEHLEAMLTFARRHLDDHREAA